MAFSYEEGDEELELQLDSLAEPSQVGALSGMRDEELGLHVLPLSPNLQQPLRGTMSSNVTGGGTQHSALYSGIDQHHAERQSLHAGHHNGHHDEEVMEEARGMQPQQERERDRERRGSIPPDPDATEHTQRKGCWDACREKCDPRSKRLRIAFCALLLLLLWAPLIYVWSHRAASSSNGGGVVPPRSTLVHGTPRPLDPTPANTLLAYVGDVALPSSGADTDKLYELIRAEGAEAMVIQGDLDYEDQPAAFDALITAHLGPAFPVFTVSGNHDVRAWPEYSEVIADRWARAGVDTCVGLAGESHTCTWKGILLIQASPGVFGEWSSSVGNAEPFLREQLARYANGSRWITCSWHKNQASMQTGGKEDDTGWGVYEACREAGAFIATGHEHSYARTFLIDSFEQHQRSPPVPDPPRLPNNASFLPLAPGSTAMFVNGLGGRSIRPNIVCGPDSPCPWFASMHNADTGAVASALFCRYHVDGDPNRARCYLKGVDGVVRDEFVLDVSDMPQMQPKEA